MKKISLIVFIVAFSLGRANESVEFNKLKGWQLQDSTLTYQTDNLWEYINGAADLFHSFGFLQLQSQDIVNDSIGATVDIYDMGTALNAYGVYMTERSPNANPVSIGSEAVIIPPYQCLMLKNRFYIKINIHEGNLNTEIGANLLSSVAAILPGENALPKELNLLPEENMVPGSLGYIRQSFQGLIELNNCTFAEYQDSVYTYQLFIIFEKMNQVWETLTNKWEALEQEDFPILFRKIPYKGYIGVTKKGGNIIGVAGLQSKEDLKKTLLSIGS